MIEAVQSLPSTQFVGWSCALGAFALFSFAAAFYHFHRARLIEDTPTSRIRSAPQGYVELEGWALPTDAGPMQADLSGTNCLWCGYTVERRETSYHNGTRRDTWRTVATGTSSAPFILEDDTGRCTIFPNGARVTSDLSREWYGDSLRPDLDGPPQIGIGLGRYRYRERLILGGEKLYALGAFTSDADGTTYSHKLRRHESRPFVISTRSQTALTGYHRATAGSSFAGTLAAAGGLAWLLAARGLF